MTDQIQINLDKSQYPDFNTLISKLISLQYERVPMVLDPGEFAVRGNIIDIYPGNHSHPIRIEFFDTSIDRLNSFNVHTQQSISAIHKTNIQPFICSEQYYMAPVSQETASNDVISDLDDDDYVVHEDHGVGQYKGLVRLSLGDREGEYLHIQYRDQDRIYVPLDQINRILRYSGSDVHPKLNSLSDGSWKRIKAKAKRSLDELAEDVYLMYKKRQAVEGHSFDEDTVWQIDMERSFEHKETEDQLKVTAEIKRDMQSERPMDRVLCGDVGYGKTEVILRAAFKAAENNKQTAVLVPTTILADQHFRTFSARFDQFPHRVEMLSRFRTKQEQAQILMDLKLNRIKVIIGTHRLLQKDIQFHDLGLLVVDEEQRFGVSHKEKIKNIKANVDVINISATPIPRTLYMALTGARDFSVLNSPPVARKPVFTVVAAYSEKIIKKAIQAEIERNGQVFYLFNNVQRMPFRFQQLQSLFPDLRIGVGHGQMKERELEDVIHGFIAQKYDILLCSTIIENGVDIPNVNTIIMENAHLFGLSQIHQIRGRVGRTQRQAFAFILYPDQGVLNDKAHKRLQAIKEYATLGSGYKLALKDLEIRGAGTLLGKKQHGHMTAIGFDLYCKLLDESVQKYRKGSEKKVRQPIVIPRDIQAFIPDDYVKQSRERLAVYRRLMTILVPDQIDALSEELRDRYGPIPETVETLFKVIRDQMV